MSSGASAMWSLVHASTFFSSGDGPLKNDMAAEGEAGCVGEGQSVKLSLSRLNECSKLRAMDVCRERGGRAVGSRSGAANSSGSSAAGNSSDPPPSSTKGFRVRSVGTCRLSARQSQSTLSGRLSVPSFFTLTFRSPLPRASFVATLTSLPDHRLLFPSLLPSTAALDASAFLPPTFPPAPRQADRQAHRRSCFHSLSSSSACATRPVLARRMRRAPPIDVFAARQQAAHSPSL